jgi:hypothetical protein
MKSFNPVTQELYWHLTATIHNQEIEINEMAATTEKIEAMLAKANPCCRFYTLMQDDQHGKSLTGTASKN